MPRHFADLLADYTDRETLMARLLEAERRNLGHYGFGLITKGDLLDQERKLAQSGLGEMFDGVEIVSNKTPDVYQRIFHEHGEGPERSMMIGNSMRSDVVPAVEIGAWGVFVPHGLEWEIEKAEPPIDAPRYLSKPDLSSIPELVAQIG